MDKKAKIGIITTAVLLSAAITVAATLGAANIMAASTPYSCDLPLGFSEIKAAIDIAKNLSENVDTPIDMKIRGTVTRVAGVSAYIQRVNQTTHELDSIQLYNVSNLDDIVEGCIIDLDGGTINNYYGAPKWKVQSGYSISYNENPYGFAPQNYYTLEDFSERAFYNHEGNYMYSCGKLVKIHNVKLAEEITAADITSANYTIRNLRLTDGENDIKASINTGDVTKTNQTKADLNDYYDRDISLDITGVLSYEYNEKILRIVSYDDVQIHETDASCTSISLDSETLSVKKGDYATLKATTEPAGLSVSFYSSNTSIATVNERGSIYAVAPGQTTITAECLGKTATCHVTVTDSLNAELTFLAINDFHGSVIEEGNHPGIVSVAGILSSYNSDNTLLINSGDMFQGSIESNHNHGELLSKVINNLNFAASTIGNHEFDWGDSYIKANAIHQGMQFLGANIYHYDINTKTTLDFASDLCAKYNIVVKNGVKVGLIGTIGSKQITSISSQLVDDYTFLNPIPIIKSISDELRVNQGCDVVVLSHHGEQDELLGQGVTSISPVSNKRYIDAAFCGHTHRGESATENGVSFVQTAGYGSSIAKTILQVDETGVSTKSYDYTMNSYGGYDATTEALVNEYKAVSDVIGNEILCTMDKYRLETAQISNLYNKAVYEKAIDYDSSILLAMGNNARTQLYNSGYEGSNYKISYAGLYESLPFDNRIIIGDATGADIIKEARYAYFYRPANSQGLYPSLSPTATYRIAVLDYVGLHRNESRNYDYIPSLVPVSIVPDITYRDITADYLRGLGHVVANDYLSSNSCFDRNTL